MRILVECFISKESAPVFTLGFVKGLKSNGVDVYALLVDSIENKNTWFEVLDEDHMYFFNNEISKKKNPIRAIREYTGVWTRFKNVRFDYVFDTFPNGIGEQFLRLIKYYETIGICHDVIPHSSTQSKESERVTKAIEKLDNVVVLSRSFKNAAMNRFHLDEKHVFYLRHGAMSYPEKNKELDYCGLKQINYLYFGRIDGYKGLHVLAKAYEELSRKYGNVSLTVAGSGDFSEYRDEYEELPNCTVVNRYLNDEDISYYFNMPNVVLVLPYIDATQSGVIGMAFNYRTPVIVSDTGGLKEQLFDGEMGLFVIPGDSQSLYNEMEKFITNNSLIEEQRELMEIGYQKSTWEYCVKEFLEQFEIKRSI